MRNTPNYNLPQYEGADKFTKEVLNDAFTKVDTAINDLQETFNINGTGSAITTQEVVNARGGKQNLKERIDEIDIKVDTNTSQLDSIEQYKSSNYIFNKNALVKIPSKRYTRGVCIGDSIGAGVSSPNNFGFIQKYNDTLKIIQNENGSGISHFYDRTNINWSKENVGICKFLMSSTDISSNVNIYQYGWTIPNQKYKIAITYSTRPDGGTFTLVSNGNTILTVNCNGATKDGLITDFVEVDAGQNATITLTTGQKAYINCWEVVISKNGVYNPINTFENWSVGGRKASDYVVSDIETMLSYKKFDYLIWELFANDWSGQNLETYTTIAEYTLSRARTLGMDIIIPICCGNEMSTQEAYKDKWVMWKNKQYELAKKYNACIIDYDVLFGGYVNAKANGLLADIIHPTDLGHTMMANELCKTILNDNCSYYKGIVVDNQSSYVDSFGYLKYNSTIRNSGKTFLDDLYLYTNDNNGNIKFAQSQPVLNLWNGIGTAPRFAPSGAIANVNGLLYRNTVDWGVNKTTQSNFQIASAYMYLQQITSLPSAGSTRQEQIYLYKQTGKDDQLVVCIRKADGVSYTWKALTLNDVL